MIRKPGRNSKKSKKVKVNPDSMVEHDEYVGFIVGYTSNGVPYGLSHEEWDKINPETNKEKPETDFTDLPF